MFRKDKAGEKLVFREQFLCIDFLYLLFFWLVFWQMHIEAAKMLQFSEEEFVKALEWGS